MANPETNNPSDVKKWTLLIYMAGDNNLSEECVYLLKEIKRIGTTNQNGDPKLNVVIQFDPIGRGNPTRRFKITSAGHDSTVENDELPWSRRKESDTGDPEVLLDFLCESIAENDTSYYMVVLAGHGAGMREGFFLQDDERPLSTIPSSFPIPMLRRVFGSDRLKRTLRGKKINILGLDACLMSMVEVCYELRNSTTLDLAIAAEGFALNSGWPLDRIVAQIKDHSDLEPTPLAEFIVADYIKYYYDYYLGGASVDQGIIHLDRVERLKSEIDDLAETLIREFQHESWANRESRNDEADDETDDSDGDEDSQEAKWAKHFKYPRYYYDESGRPFQDTILLAHWAAQSYNGEQCVDLYDFCNLLQQRRPEWEHTDEYSVWFACQRVKEALQDGSSPAIHRSCFTGATFQYSFGASLYFPWGRLDLDPSYNSLEFGKYSAWTKFLKLYLRATQRLPRNYKFGERLKEREYRYTPPTDRGPSGKVFSMRNPPTEFKKIYCVGVNDSDSPEHTGRKTNNESTTRKRRRPR